MTGVSVCGRGACAPGVTCMVCVAGVCTTGVSVCGCGAAGARTRAWNAGHTRANAAPRPIRCGLTAGRCFFATPADCCGRSRTCVCPLRPCIRAVSWPLRAAASVRCSLSASPRPPFGKLWRLPLARNLRAASWDTLKRPAEGLEPLRPMSLRNGAISSRKLNCPSVVPSGLPSFSSCVTANTCLQIPTWLYCQHPRHTSW